MNLWEKSPEDTIHPTMTPYHVRHERDPDVALKKKNLSFCDMVDIDHFVGLMFFHPVTVLFAEHNNMVDIDHSVSQIFFNI